MREPKEKPLASSGASTRNSQTANVITALIAKREEIDEQFTTLCGVTLPPKRDPAQGGELTRIINDMYRRWAGSRLNAKETSANAAQFTVREAQFRYAEASFRDPRWKGVLKALLVDRDHAANVAFYGFHHLVRREQKIGLAADR